MLYSIDLPENTRIVSIPDLKVFSPSDGRGVTEREGIGVTEREWAPSLLSFDSAKSWVGTSVLDSRLSRLDLTQRSDILFEPSFQDMAEKLPA